METAILIENRSGSRYSGGVFILTIIEDLVKLSQEIDKSGSNLRITIDIPQLYTTHGVSIDKPDLMIELFEQVAYIRHNIRGYIFGGRRIVLIIEEWHTLVI